MKRKARVIAVSTALVCAAWSGVGHCREDPDGRDRERQAHEFREQRGDVYRSREYDEIRSLQQRGAILPLQQILERAQRYRRGRVLETELDQKGERYIYELEMVDDRGQVWEMKFDAASGELLKDEQED
jgi:uncharacterized membrane protein YkoI